MKKDKVVVLFYILYFSWLFSIVYLVNYSTILDIFTFFVAIFYFLFINEKYDIFYFLTGATIVTLGSLYALSRGSFYLGGVLLTNIPYWLPISWGTTIVALRKFYIIMNHR